MRHSAITSMGGGTCVCGAALLSIQRKIPTPTQAARSARRTLSTYRITSLLITINIYIIPRVNKVSLMSIDCKIHQHIITSNTITIIFRVNVGQMPVAEGMSYMDIAISVTIITGGNQEGVATTHFNILLNLQGTAEMMMRSCWLLSRVWKPLAVAILTSNTTPYMSNERMPMIVYDIPPERYGQHHRRQHSPGQGDRDASSSSCSDH